MAKDTEKTPEAIIVPVADPERLAAIKGAKPLEIELVEHVGPCGDDNPCGGGFGAA